MSKYLRDVTLGDLEKGGLGARLKAVGLQAGQGIVWGDEMKLGLRGQVRQVWAPRGVAVSQAVQIGWKYIYVAVALDPMTGRLWWAWQAKYEGRGDGLHLANLGPGAGHRRLGLGRGPRPHGRGHASRGRAPGGIAALRPRTEPGGAFFRELRRAIEGRVYPTLQAKQDALQPVLEAWQADPKRVRQLCGWDWIWEAQDPARQQSSRMDILDWY